MGTAIAILCVVGFVIAFAVRFSKKETDNINKHKQYQEMQKRAFQDENIDN